MTRVEIIIVVLMMILILLQAFLYAAVWDKLYKDRKYLDASLSRISFSQAIGDEDILKRSAKHNSEWLFPVIEKTNHPSDDSEMVKFYRDTLGLIHLYTIKYGSDERKFLHMFLIPKYKNFNITDIELW